MPSPSEFENFLISQNLQLLPDFRTSRSWIDLIALGPRVRIYEETYRILRKEGEKRKKIVCWSLSKPGKCPYDFLANLPMFVAAIPRAKQKMIHRPLLITTVIFVQIVITLILVGLLS